MTNPSPRIADRTMKTQARILEKLRMKTNHQEPMMMRRTKVMMTMKKAINLPEAQRRPHLPKTKQEPCGNQASRLD